MSTYGVLIMAKKKSKVSRTVEPSSNIRRDVNIEKARNGFVVSFNDKNYNKVNYIAKDKNEAKKIAMKLL